MCAVDVVPAVAIVFLSYFFLFLLFNMFACCDQRLFACVIFCSTIYCTSKILDDFKDF